MAKEGFPLTVNGQPQLPVAAIHNRQRRLPANCGRNGFAYRDGRYIHGRHFKARPPDRPAQCLDRVRAGNRHTIVLRVPAAALRYVIECGLTEIERRSLSGLDASLLLAFSGWQIRGQREAVQDDIGAVEAHHGVPRARRGLLKRVPDRVSRRIVRPVLRRAAKREAARAYGPAGQLDRLDRARADIEPQHCFSWPQSVHGRLVY